MPSAPTASGKQRVSELLWPGTARVGATFPGDKRTTPTRSSSREVMLQQTQVDRVVPRYLRWLERWPNVEALAAAPAADVIVEWQGLGYNRRAVSLHRGGADGRRARLARRPDGATRASARIRPRRSRNFAFGRRCCPSTRTSAVSRSGPARASTRLARRRSSISARRSAWRGSPAASACPLAAVALRAAGATSRFGGSRRSRARFASAAQSPCARCGRERQRTTRGDRLAAARRARRVADDGRRAPACLDAVRAALRPGRRDPRRRPVKPSRSVVVARTLTSPSPIAACRRARISSRWAAIRGASPTGRSRR